MLVGPTGGGKTSVYRVLSSGMTALANHGQSKVNLHILNPKSIKIPSQLYGDYN
jgi:dynein heavy chain